MGNVRALCPRAKVLALYLTGCSLAFGATQVSSPALEERFQRLVEAMPPRKEHYDGTTEESVRQKASREAAYAAITKEKLQKKWFAALIPHAESEPLAIHGRFETWRGLLEFLQRSDAIVEMWALTPTGAQKYRRIPATEWDQLRRANHEQPHFLTVTYRNEAGRVVTDRVEFGFQSAQVLWEAQAGYQRHRQLLRNADEILNARNEAGDLAAMAQWKALTNAVANGKFDLELMPPAPLENDPLFVAVEYAVDANGNYARALRVFPESQLHLTVEGDVADARQVVTIREPFKDVRVAEAFRTRGVSDELEPVRNSLLGQDEVELRISDPTEPDARKWPTLEFGGPSIFKQAGLAKFARINAQMDRRRKELALKKSNADLFIEPIVAALNIGGGVGGLGFPIGEALRIPYNVIVPQWIPKVPKVAEMREVFALLAAKELDPELSAKPYEYLTQADVDKLRAAGRLLSEAEIRRYLATISASDIEAMTRLARMGMIDARVTNFLNLLTSIFKVTGASEQAGFMREVFNSVYFSLSGDINISTILLVAAGQKGWTPLSGISLKALVNGEGPAEAWAQFFIVSVDVRAVINSLVRWFKPTLAKKELEKPFPYATRLGDIAAYEFRAFGFPLLLIYKRGLIKADVEAYENDYAYGVIATKIVVRFPTKKDMEREILAGRLHPLGLVKVPDGKGGWKETNLAVFAYELPSGQHKGEIALIIYGLKAYYDYSELMDRELQRFERFEQALREGAVFERVVDAEDRGSVPPEDFEPKIYLGADAREKVFAPLLASLLELRRVDRYRALGLPVTEADQKAAELARKKLLEQGYDLPEEDSLIDVDKFNSAFVYRRLRGGKRELVKMSAFSSVDDIARELAKADENRGLAEIRRKVAAGESEGLITLNSAREVNGELEIGPLLPSDQLPSWLQKGGGSGSAALNRVFERLDNLSAMERGRLMYNNYTATAVDLDLRGDGQKQKVFLTVEFPPGRVTRISTNATSRKVERRVFENGRPIEIATDQNVVEFAYDASGTETETKKFGNAGTLEAPQKGPLLQSTRTTEVWHRDLNQAAADPSAPLISKLTLNHLTGEQTLETYSLFSLPIQTVDEQFVTTRRFDGKGRFLEATVVENGKSEQDFERPVAEKLANPIPGAVRFHSTATTERATTDSQSVVTHEDVLHGTARTVILDDLHSGRPIQENFTDEAELQIHYSYNDDWWWGAIPEKAVVQSANSGSILREIRYIDFNPELRRLTGVETDYRGTVLTQVWDYRWSAPIETETALRKTTVSFDRRGMSGQGRTIDKQSGETVRDFTVAWSPNAQAWESIDQWWHAPSAPLRKETNWLSGFGRLIRTESFGIFRTVPRYDADGREVERRISRKNPQNGNFDILQRVEDDFRWESGRRDARVRVWVDGELYEESRAISDEEGRLITSGIKSISNIGLKTQIIFDRGTERRFQTVSFQNADVRRTEQFYDARQTNGFWVVPGKSIPAWGLVATNYYPLSDPFGRPEAAVLEDGKQIRVREWFDGTAIPRISERLDARGKVQEQWNTRLRAGMEGSLAYDLTTRAEVSPWGETGLADSRALLSGTEILLFKDAAGERVYFDTTKAFDAPLYGRSLANEFGVTTSIHGSTVTNVARLYHTSTNNEGSQLAIERIDLLGFFNKAFARQLFHRGGNLLEERTGILKKSLPPDFNAVALFAALSNSPASRQAIYRYEPGALITGTDADGGVALRFFTNTPSAGTNISVVNQIFGDTPTRIDGLATTSGTNQQLRSVSSRRVLERNPWLPHLINTWTEWTTTEGLDRSAKPLQTTVIYNAQGLPVVTRTPKLAVNGEAAEKIAFELPPPNPEDWQEVKEGAEKSVALPLSFTNASSSYFLYFFLRGARKKPELLISDAKGAQVVVGTARRKTEKNRALFWPTEGGYVLWSPDENDPREGVALSRSTSMGASEQLWAVPVPALGAAGLDVSSIRGVSLRLSNPPAEKIHYTAPQLVRRISKKGGFAPKISHDFQEIAFGSGLHSIIGQSARGGWRGSLVWNGVPVLEAFQREALESPRMIVSDHSEPNAPRPLYTLNAEDASFIESYQVFKYPSQTRFYSAVNGFESPRLEVFRSEQMADELRPGLLAYGRDVPVVIAPTPGRSDGGTALDELKLRLQASAWKQIGDQTLGFHGEAAEAGLELARLNRTGAPEEHAQQIGRFPVLAEGLVPFRPIPWLNYTSAPPVLSIPPNVLKLRLELALRSNQPDPSGAVAIGENRYQTPLISTSPGGEAEQFVETSAEGELIELAIAVGATNLAAGALGFYSDHSNGGVEPLFDSYDASTGASVFKSPNYERPIDAPRSAGSQLAIAEASLRFAATYGDTNALALGRNLLVMLLSSNRVEQLPGVFGITEEIALSQRKAGSLALLPPARRFSLGTNARLYTLLRQLNEWLGTKPENAEFHAMAQMAQGALRDEEHWLRVNFIDQTNDTVVFARGIFELQDAGSGASAYAPERATSTEDSLALIEAADLLGVPKERTRVWLENLARAHGAHVGSVWGLDWTVPWRRPEAISSRLTAKFLSVARQLGHSQAANFAQEQISRMVKPRGEMVGVLSPASTSLPLLTGLGSVVYPDSKTHRWPSDLATYNSLVSKTWPASPISSASVKAARSQRRDINAFFWTAALIYLAVLATTFFWWLLYFWRKRRSPIEIASVVTPTVMQKGEERWTKCVLGVITPANADRTRFSNAPVEGNFHMQLRAIYKIVLEWRRVENGWSEDDPRLAENGSDAWLNGIDEFAAMLGIYSRWVVKAGKKDGLRKSDPFQENEDSNHIWSRLVLYLSEYLWGLLQLLKQFKANPAAARVLGINEQIEAVLRTMGARLRREAFDGRVLFDFPARPEAMDLLALQLPGATLPALAEQMEQRLRIPRAQFRTFLKNYKTFKYREQVYPIHPYIIEASKLFPHFILMGLVSVIWYNQNVNGLLIYPYLKQLAFQIFESARSLWWGVPLMLGAGFAVAAGYVHSYRYIGSIRSHKKERLVLDAEIGSLLKAQQSALPSIRPGWRWDPVWYEHVGWLLRGVGMVGLAIFLMGVSAPSLATFTLVKGLFVPILLAEAAAILLPLLLSFFSAWLEDRVSSGKRTSALARFVNQLNLTPTRPASILWHGLKYHFQSSVPSGGVWAMTRCIAFYFLFTATFFLIGSYSFKEVLRVWFAQRYHHAWDWELAIGSVIFWNTMYLLRFGLFVFFVGTGSFLVTFPFQGVALGVALLYLLLSRIAPSLLPPEPANIAVALCFMAGVLVSPWLRERFSGGSFWRGWLARKRTREDAALKDLRSGEGRTLAVVYMSGDDLSSLKLTPELLLNRLQTLRDKLGSEGASVLLDSIGVVDETVISAAWGRLHALEKKQNVTLWHPMQFVVPGETARLEDALGLNLPVESKEERDTLLNAWQIRRWLVTMMSTAGHAQDTAINLVDIALRLTEEGLSKSVAFYLIQNKYDNNDNNRPSQINYGQGELAQRNKLAHFLMAVAPGSRAYNINDWTPFGFKAGGLVGMDFIHEESLHLSNMLVLDRNANTNDLNALMDDLKSALADPGVIIVVPGRSTTNALTPLGQASQLVEEGHRAMVKGLMAIGGGAGESVGTGWGNIQAIYYGRVQQALLDPESPKMPLTSRMRQGSTFQEKSYGLIGFGPHAVGISEDIWGVTQAAHNAIALGKTVKFRESKAFWHKIRETWSHAEWFSAFPRWSGGYLQMMLDPIMQKINDGGPLSVFAKEIRANCGRFFLSAPFALLNILLMPLAILWDVSPFVQVLVVLWLFGLVMNQVLTMLGAIAYLEATGFARLPALVGAVLGGALCQVRPAFKLLTPAAILLGGVGGGFAAGVGKWLFNRGRDLIVFGPQLVIHALGQIVRQSLEFVLSGASADDAKGVNIAFRGWVGPREDRPWERYANFINLRTVIWGVGLLSLLLNIIALAKLDFLNALLLLPSLFFSISTLIGPFLMAPKPGKATRAGSVLPKVAGWAGGAAYFIILAALLTQKGWPLWVGLGVALMSVCSVGYAGLRYLGYPRRLRRSEEKLSELLQQAGIEPANARKLAQQAVRVFQGDAAKLKPALAAANLDATTQERIANFSEKVLQPIIKKPILDVHGPQPRWIRGATEFKRSFALSLFTLLWFLFVPVPGLLVFSGLGYRVSLPLPALTNLVLGLIALTLLAYALSRVLERFTLAVRIRPRLKALYQRFQTLLARKGALADGEISRVFGCYTDALTYTDQRGYSYAMHSLQEAEDVLLAAEKRLSSP